MVKTSPVPIDMDPCSHEKNYTLVPRSYELIYNPHKPSTYTCIYIYICIYIYAYYIYIYMCMIYIYSFHSYAYHFSLVIGRMSYQRWQKGHHLVGANRQELLHQLHPTKRGSSTCLVNVTRGVGTYSLVDLVNQHVWWLNQLFLWQFSIANRNKFPVGTWQKEKYESLPLTDVPYFAHSTFGFPAMFNSERLI